MFKPCLNQENKKGFQISLKALVLEAGLEPARPKGHKILSLACLPIPPLEHHPEFLRDSHNIP